MDTAKLDELMTKDDLTVLGEIRSQLYRSIAELADGNDGEMLERLKTMAVIIERFIHNNDLFREDQPDGD